MTRIAVAGTYNLRDLGGLPVAGGRVSQNGVLFRSDSLHALTPQGAAVLAELGIRTVIDLRSDGEVGRAPNLLEGLGMAEHRMPLYDAAEPAARIDFDAGLEGMYRDLIATAGPVLAAAARKIATSDGPVLVHCTAGKDRTGLVMALVLDAVGVERAAVVADYASTEANLAGEWAEVYIAHLTKDVSLGADDLVRFMTASPAELLSRLLDDLDRDSEGAAGYLRQHGVTDHELILLERKLVSPPDHRAVPDDATPTSTP
jgi:protein-tyrosine phosphatase